MSGRFPDRQNCIHPPLFRHRLLFGMPDHRVASYPSYLNLWITNKSEFSGEGYASRWHIYIPVYNFSYIVYLRMYGWFQVKQISVQIFINIIINIPKIVYNKNATRPLLANCQFTISQRFGMNGTKKFQETN